VAWGHVEVMMGGNGGRVTVEVMVDVSGSLVGVD
jgi:hypothetical protein